ncbi:class I SAM-dependent methyltransferase [Pseudomonadales bacterium]|nr:class I SAM-dependent methyltransferase [Pseudomonadales bacterium]MDB9868738.1 class I SAM-dependent methyltransferase [Pseudomonadales bacterium]
MDKIDYTPEKFSVESIPIKEQIKSKIRGFVYPLLTSFRDKKLKREFDFSNGYDELYLGQRGNDYVAQRKRLNQLSGIENKTVLIIGCGKGNDLESWMKYNPKKIIAVDLFNYQKAWKIQKKYLINKYDIEVEFAQADIKDLGFLTDESVDIIGSDAVFEHLNDFKSCLSELKRVLSKDGILYSTFGPLWYTWGGDHVSGTEDFSNGYNHILLEESDYHKYLDSFGEHNHDSNDGRTWVYNKLFSYYKPTDYINSLEDLGFKFLWKSVILEPRAIKFLNMFQDKKVKLLNKDITYEDLVITGMTVIIIK